MVSQGVSLNSLFQELVNFNCSCSGVEFVVGRYGIQMMQKVALVTAYKSEVFGDVDAHFKRLSVEHLLNFSESKE